MEIVIPVLIVVVILIVFLSRGLDTDRVKEDIESKGGTLLEKNWSPFGKGWLGNKKDRIYEVRYLDKDGNEHLATCKTSMFSGVYWTDDHIVKYADSAEGGASLEEENRRLRDEIKRLRREQND